MHTDGLACAPMGRYAVVEDIEFEWDSRKSEWCLAERGIDFSEAMRIFYSPHLTLDGASGREERYRAVGQVEGRCLTVVWTPRGGGYRIITAWISSRKERRLYYEFIKKER